MKVKFLPELKFEVKGKTKDRHVKHGQAFTINCESTAYPVGSVSWFFTKDKIKKNLQPIHHKDALLKINKMSSKDAGLYECIVENSVGQTNKFIKVDHISNCKL